jgi:uncharacterized lipoprotein YmbA
LKLYTAAAACLCLLCACATGRPDHFYILTAQPATGSASRTSPTVQATLKVSLPSLVDRSEIVLNTSADAISVLEHERWGAPLIDLVSQTLAQDIERRRSDVLVGGVGRSNTTGPGIKITVDIVQVWMRRGEPARIEAHWRIQGPQAGKESSGAEAFSAPLGRDGYDAVARTWSECVALLADRLAEQIPRGE